MVHHKRHKIYRIRKHKKKMLEKTRKKRIKIGRQIKTDKKNDS